MEYVFVYGTLLSDFLHPLNKKMQKEGKLIGKGFVFGKMYDVGTYPAAIPSFDSIILGEVYQIPEILFFDIDDYEDYNVYIPNESLFKRKKTKVYLLKEITENIHPEEFIRNKEKFPKIFSWIYWYNRPVEQLKRIPQIDYPSYFENKEYNHR
jgi:gamma-glutamylcyclotransferase (GGCT)/AIG2-like uncharacterized protein YtfP